MHFARTTLFWTCLQSLASESYPHGIPEFFYPGCLAEVNLRESIRVYKQDQGRVVFPGQQHDMHQSYLDDLRRKVHVLWQGFIHFYSQLGLTQQSDILVALRGISQHVIVDTLHERIIAGIPESNLLMGLSWWSSGSFLAKNALGRPHRPSSWRAPSWSWASTMCAITYNTAIPHHLRHDMARVVSIHAPTRPSGQLIEASLRIEGRPFLVTIRRNGWRAEIILPHGETVGQHDTLLMDDPCYEAEHDNICNVFLFVLWYSEPREMYAEDIGALILETCGTGQKQFRRIGYATAYFIASRHITDRKYWIETILRMHDKAELRVIEIV
jgi:hypothetical protein